MSNPGEDVRHARNAARVLAEAGEPPMGPSTIGDRAGTILAIEQALGARRRRRRPWVLATVAAAAAAALLLVIAGRSSRSPDAPVAIPSRPLQAEDSAALTIVDSGGSNALLETPAGTRPAAAGGQVAPGTWVRGGRAGVDNDVVIAMETGTRVRVGAGARVQVAELGASQRFVLHDGRFEANVAKVGPNRRFIVGTPDAEVEVRGTRFEVVVGADRSACAPHVRTRVVVSEGVVAVRHAAGEARLSAGQTWPACEPRDEERARPAEHAAPSDEAPPRPRRIAGKVAVASPAEAPPGSTLAEQNDLFAAALAARRRGDASEALRWLDRLLARYPNGQLVDSARAERQRLLEASRQGNRPE